MEIKEERRRARGWSARRRERANSPGCREPAASALGGAEGRAEQGTRGDSFGVSGPRGFPAALGRPVAGGGESRLGGSVCGGAKGSPRGGVTPRSLGGPRGSTFLSCP